ncbi:MAG: energy-coupling factor ABC transporter ATP-binding protein [Solirubrobacteraceae bacterium]
MSLLIGRGEYVALIGQNGSGKTTLARHLNGLLRPTAGTVSFDGEDLAESSVAELSRSVGYVFQNPDHQLFGDSVEKEIGFGPVALGLAEDVVAGRVAEALRMCGIEHLRTEHPLFTSRGERQLIAIASIVAMQPPVIVFDEPTTGLDETYYQLVLDLMDALRNAGHTIVVISHEMRLVSERCERTIVLKDGMVVADAPTREVFKQTALLAETKIAPTQITQLSHLMESAGVSTALSVDELVVQMLPRSGAPEAESFPQTSRR